VEKQRQRVEHGLRLLERGLSLASEAPDRFLLLVEHGELLPELGRTPEAIEDLQAALALAADGRELGRAWTAMAAAMRFGDQYQAALDALDSTQAAIERAGTDLDAASTRPPPPRRVSQTF
jgi:tetratricopeptide (TPR) repeat protein